MKLAFSVSGHRNAAEAVAIAALADDMGYRQVWLTEDYCERGAFAVAGAVAAATGRIEIGIGVVNPWTRHPMLTAMEHAALDEISQGRAILGMGASNVRWMEEQLGIPFRAPLKRLKESVDLLRAALSGEPVAHAGDAFAVDARLAFSPPRTRPPIFLGVKGRHALALAGAVADGVLLSILSSPAYVSWSRERIGRPLDVAAYVGFACHGDRKDARDTLRPMVATFLGVHGDHDITRVAGMDPELCAVFRARWREGRPAVELVTDEILDTFAVAGSPDDCAGGFTRFQEAGLDILVIRDDGSSDPRELLEQGGRCYDLTG